MTYKMYWSRTIPTFLIRVDEEGQYYAYERIHKKWIEIPEVPKENLWRSSIGTKDVASDVKKICKPKATSKKPAIIYDHPDTYYTLDEIVAKYPDISKGMIYRRIKSKILKADKHTTEQKLKYLIVDKESLDKWYKSFKEDDPTRKDNGEPPLPSIVYTHSNHYYSLTEILLNFPKVSRSMIYRRIKNGTFKAKKQISSDQIEYYIINKKLFNTWHDEYVEKTSKSKISCQ